MKRSLKSRRRGKDDKRRGKKNLDRALMLQRSGDLAGAERLYREIIAKNPSQSTALHHLGLLSHQRGAREEAIAFLERSMAADGSDVSGWNNLGNFYWEGGQLEQAVRAYRRAIVLAPEHINTLHNLGTILLDTGAPGDAVQYYHQLIRLDDADVEAWHGLGIALDVSEDVKGAEDAYRAALERAPTLAAAWYDLGNLLRHQGALDGARDALLQSVTIEPGFAEAYNNLGIVYRDLDQPDKAATSFKRSIELRPTHAETYLNLVSLLVVQNDLESATQRMEKLVALDPSDSERQVKLAEIQFQCEDYTGAERTLRLAIELDPDSASAHSTLGKTLVKLAQSAEAEVTCRRAIELDPTLADAYGNLGTALKLQARLNEAIEAYQQSLILDPDYAEAYNNLGLAYVDCGEFTKADECYCRALELAPDMPEPLINIAMSRKFSRADQGAMDNLQTLLERDDLRKESRIALHFALGKVLDDCGEYAQALEHYRTGNLRKAETVRFDRAKHVIMIKALRESFDRDRLASLQGLGDPSRLPVFIIGMPRSGTSLVEQILASHPLFFGADELTEIGRISKRLSVVAGSSVPYPESVHDLTEVTCRHLAEEYLDKIREFSPDAIRISDKMPYNYLHLGLISVLLPNARIIHCRRDPRDVCLSNYFQLYADAHHYTYQLDDLILYNREYERLMDFWRDHLPIDIHEVRYEDLVADLEGSTRALLSHVDLPWDPTCLSFHQTHRPVQTASHWQVKQPLYQSSTARWKRYESELGEFFNKLMMNARI